MKMIISSEPALKEYLETRKINKFHIRLTLICLLILTLDGFDMTIMGFVASSVMDHWQVSHEIMGLTMSAGLIGLTCGALIGGNLADRFGRKNVIFGAVLVFGLLSVASAFSTDITMLIVLRFLTGFGLGAAQPNVATLISEYAPVKYRSTLIGIVYCGITLGSAIVGLIAKAAIPVWGWESVFIIGGVLPLLSLILIALYLPESLLYLINKKRSPEYIGSMLNRIDAVSSVQLGEFRQEHHALVRKSSPFLKIIKRPYMLCTLSLWLGIFTNLMCVNFLSNWMPLLIKESGFSLSDAALIGAVTQIGGTLGNFCIGYIMDRRGYHKTMFIGLIGAVVFSLLLTQYHDSLAVIACIAFFLGITVNAVNTGWTTLSSSYYPTAIRATGTSTMMAAGRIGAILGAFLGGVILAAGVPAIYMFYFLAIPLFLSSLSVLLNRRLISPSRNSEESPSENLIVLPDSSTRGQ